MSGVGAATSPRLSSAGDATAGLLGSDFKAANLFPREVEFLGDVLLFDVTGGAGLEDLVAEVKLSGLDEFARVIPSLVERGFGAADAGHRVGHPSMFAPLVRPTYQGHLSYMPHSMWRKIETGHLKERRCR